MKIIVELKEEKYEISDRLEMMVAINEALESMGVEVNDVYFDKGSKEVIYRESKNPAVERLFDSLGAR